MDEPLTPAAAPLKSRIARSVFWIAWSRGGLQLIAFATTLVVARILHPADYGVMAIAGIWTTAMGELAEMGLGAAIIQFRDLTKRDVDTCFWITITIATAGCIALSLSAGAISRWFDVPALAAVLPAVSFMLPLTAIRVVPDSLLRKDLALDRISQAEIIGGLATLPVTLACALAGYGVWALVAGSLVGPAARSAATFAFAPWRPGLQFGGSRIKDMLHFSVATLGTRVFWVFREQADVFVIGKITGGVTVGFYSMAKQVALLPTSKISTVVNMLSSPVMAELQSDANAMRAAFYRGVRFTASIALPSCVGMALVAHPLVAVLLGPKWLPIVGVFRLLCFFAAVRALDVLLPPVLLARHRARFLFCYSAALLLILPLAAALGALWDGAVGAVLCTIPVYCAVMSIMAREALREIGVGYAALWAELRSIIAATAAMAACVAIAGVFARTVFAGLAPLELLVLSALGAMVYLATLFYLGSTAIDEGLEMIGWLMRRRS